VTDRFRILIATDSDVEGLGGSERHVRVVAEQLCVRGHEAHILQLAPVVPTATGRIGGATFEHWPTGPILSLAGLRRAYQLRSRIIKGRYSAVLSFFESSDMLCLAAGATCGMHALLSSRRDTGFRLSPRMVRAYRRFNHRFKVIIAASGAVRDSLISTQCVNPSQLRIIHNGTDIAVLADPATRARTRDLLGIRADQKAIVYVANFDEWKDHETLLRAFARLGNSDANVLVLPGAGGREQACRDLAASLGVADRVRFLGARRDIPDVLRACDLFVMSSRTEGLSNALLEAMAAGLPIIATDVGGNPEVVDEGVTGELVQPGDAVLLSQRMHALLSDRARLEAMGIAARERAKARFSLTAMVDGYERAIVDSIAVAKG
jgi:glycosyltransferase involved in cell wall biosynthesis